MAADIEDRKRRNQEAVRKYRALHPDRKRASAKKYREAHPDRAKAVIQKWREEHPDADRAIQRTYKQGERGRAALRAQQAKMDPARLRARRKVQYEVKMGRLLRGPCAVCGYPGETQGHHANGYEPPFDLDVVWLCLSDHQAVHRAG